MCLEPCARELQLQLEQVGDLHAAMHADGLDRALALHAQVGAVEREEQRGREECTRLVLKAVNPLLLLSSAQGGTWICGDQQPIPIDPSDDASKWAFCQTDAAQRQYGGAPGQLTTRVRPPSTTWAEASIFVQPWTNRRGWQRTAGDAWRSSPACFPLPAVGPPGRHRRWRSTPSRLAYQPPTCTSIILSS